MKSSFVKVSMLLGTSFFVAGSANAGRGVIVNDEYLGLQEQHDQLNAVIGADASQQADFVVQKEAVEEAAPVEQVESSDISNEVSENETHAANEEQVAVHETSVADEKVVAINEISELETTSEEDSNVVVSEAKPEDEGDGFETASSMSTEDLEGSRGAFSPSNSSILQANSSNNSVNNSVTGGNVISEGAFNSNSGLVNVIQNSGNNVLIQSSTIVNVQMNQ